MKNIFVTGGVGYIGSHIVIELVKSGYKPIIIDNFSNSHFDMIEKLDYLTKKKIIYHKIDLKNKKKLNLIFKKYSCHAVIHCAGYKVISESIKKPINYFENNIGATLALLHCMEQNSVFNLIFSSSAAVYDDGQSLPLKESGKTGSTKNPYGTSKYIIERMLIDLATYDKRWSVTIARYFNPISNHFTGYLKENSKNLPNNLIPVILNVIKKKNLKLNVFGNNYKTKDGTCVRDYIHVMDLAKGHIQMLKKRQIKKGLKIYNLGSGHGFSVLEVIKAFEKNLEKKIPFKFIGKRKGDVAESYCCTNKVKKELNWKIEYTLDQAISDLKKII
jgi:UDP-glucose 4-epimerase